MHSRHAILIPMYEIQAKKRESSDPKRKIKRTETDFHPANKLCSDTFQFSLILFSLRLRT